ncbi:MAG: hypothetical protein FJX34_01900 [Alphaproteobacteria bacterium]|nr:hypothetical protein [Alphaproteobacteria bacterium]
MLTIIWFLLVASLLATSLVWLLDHNGSVIVTWLGYELQTDVMTAILLAAFFSVMLFATSYLLARILAIKFPNLLKILFKRSYTRSLEKLVARHRQALEILSKLMLALEVNDEKPAESLQKRFNKLVKNPGVNDFLLGKIFLERQQFSKAAVMFEKFGENKHAKILVLKSKLELALQNQEETQAIAYAKQILQVKHDSFVTAKQLFILYKKQGLWNEAKALIREYGDSHFSDELQKRDVAVINAALALEAYQQKKFLLAIKHTNLALRAENNFLPALEIQLKSWLRLGLGFKVAWKIKSLWKENPHLILAEIFDLVYRKSVAKTRIKMMKKLVNANPESAIGELAIGITAFRIGDYMSAKEFLTQSLAKQRSYRAYKFLAATEKALGSEAEQKKNLVKLKMFECDYHYGCSACGHITSKWSAKCSACGAHDSLDWSR